MREQKDVICEQQDCDIEIQDKHPVTQKYSKHQERSQHLNQRPTQTWEFAIKVC